MPDMRLPTSPAFPGAALVMAVPLLTQVGLVRLIALNGSTVVLGPLVGRPMNRTTPGLLLVTGLSHDHHRDGQPAASADRGRRSSV